jgi:hypothetical protein
VVCRQLGFPRGAVLFYCCSQFGPVPDVFSYDDVNCSGQETTLDACPHANVDNCGVGEGAGVICNGTDPIGKNYCLWSCLHVLTKLLGNWF